MIIVNINGPINAGKTTVSKLLAQKIKNSLLIEIDDLLSDEEQQKLNLDFWAGINLRLDKFDEILQEEINNNNYDFIIFAFPMEKNNYDRWHKTINNKALFKAITLAPSLDICLTNRGTRHITEWEIGRIKTMYNEGYQNPVYTDFIIDNSKQTPEETANYIIDFLNSCLKT